jgi:DNA-binding GntR family transcriptional regulator
VQLGSVESTVEAIPGQPDTCHVLGIPAAAPVLFRDSLHSDVGGTPRLLVHTHYRGDRVALSGVTDVDEGEIRTTSGVMARQRRATRPEM